MPANSDDDVPRWELPVYDESEETPRWTPEREVPRWQPRRGPPPAPPRSRSGPRTGSVRAGSTLPMARREAPRPVSPLAVPFVWWAAHPWVVLWTLVCLAPGSVVLLRVVDDSSLAAAVRPLAWSLGACFVVALALAMVSSAARSVARLALGTLAALSILGVLLWPVTRVTLGRTTCPARAGADLGRPVAAGALQAWQAGRTDDEAWRGGVSDAAWRERTQAVGLADYQLSGSGCWERIAPLDGTHTWHEFRVTVREPEQPPLLKTVVIHTVLGRAGWKITDAEGPLP